MPKTDEINIMRTPRSKLRARMFEQIRKARPVRRFAFLAKHARRFADLRRGMTFETTAEKISKGMLHAYQLIARERWRHTTQPTTDKSMKSRVIAPSALVIGISHGQESRIQPYELHVAKEISYRFLKPVHLGDTIRTRVRITRLENNPSRDYGYAWVIREIVNQHDEVVYRANAKLLIKK